MSHHQNRNKRLKSNTRGAKRFFQDYTKRKLPDTVAGALPLYLSRSAFTEAFRFFSSAQTARDWVASASALSIFSVRDFLVAWSVNNCFHVGKQTAVLAWNRKRAIISTDFRHLCRSNRNLVQNGQYRK